MAWYWWGWRHTHTEWSVGHRFVGDKCRLGIGGAGVTLTQGGQ